MFIENAALKRLSSSGRSGMSAVMPLLTELSRMCCGVEFSAWEHLVHSSSQANDSFIRAIGG